MTTPPLVVVAYGTRPEAIKLAPVTAALQAAGFDVHEWCSGQSPDLTGVKRFGWQKERPLEANVGEVIHSFGSYLRSRAADDRGFDAVIVQGDTATAFACAQAAFLAGVPVAHVEAGLRTYAPEPFPEEAFRRQIAAIATWHFAPDANAASNLAREFDLFGPDESYGIYVTGNTVVDTLGSAPFRILATLHRRENWGTRRTGALEILDYFTKTTPNVALSVVHHPNWSQDGARSDHAIPPIPHDQLIKRLFSHVYDLVVTDSGGLQEECAHFGTPCVVLRTSTERVALVETGAVRLVHPDDPDALRRELDSALARRRCYGDGTASTQIATILAKELANGALVEKAS